MALYNTITTSFWDRDRRLLICDIRFRRRTVSPPKPVKEPKPTVEKKATAGKRSRSKKVELTQAQQVLFDLLKGANVDFNTLVERSKDVSKT